MDPLPDMLDALSNVADQERLYTTSSSQPDLGQMMAQLQQVQLRLQSFEHKPSTFDVASDMSNEGTDEAVATVEDPAKAEKLFYCKFCEKSFNTSQALGGHQNCHRYEQRSARRAKEQADLLKMPLPPPPLRLHPVVLGNGDSNINNNISPYLDANGNLNYNHCRIPNSPPPHLLRYQPYAAPHLDRYNNGNFNNGNGGAPSISREIFLRRLINLRRNYEGGSNGVSAALENRRMHAYQQTEAPAVPNVNPVNANEVRVRSPEPKEEEVETELDLTLHL